METRTLGSGPNIMPRTALSRSGRVPGFVQKQDGGVAVVFAVALTALLGFCGLALDMALVYNRNVEMRNVADAAALAAARKLNGTASGITDAVAAAAAATTALKYEYGRGTVSWSAAAIKFSTSPDRGGTWLDAGSAVATASRIYYAKVDTGELDGVGDVHTAFMPVLSESLTTVTARSVAVAGRTTINVTPLAICAMSETAAQSRPNGALPGELVEYGFRRGISYDLMQLNPSGTAAVSFLINPLAAPGTSGAAADMLPAAVGPYICAGTLGIPRVSGDTIAVSGPFPLDPLYKQLNSRFDQYDDAVCNFHAAPPDTNIQSYVFTAGTNSVYPWLNSPTAQTAAITTTRGKRETVADLPYPAGTPADYGPVWASAKAVPFSAYAAGVPEPTPNGYTPYANTNWSTLYAGQTVKTYPAGTFSTPYKATTGVNSLLPITAHRPGAKGRRVLNVPLLSCSPTLPGTSATVLAIGRFFMTVPATPTVLAAEFAGASPLQNIDGQVGLFP